MSAGLQRASPQIGGSGDLPGDLSHRLEVTGRGDGKSGLDDVDTQIDKRPRDFQLFAQVHAGSRRLLAIAECRIKDLDLAVRTHRSFLSLLWDLGSTSIASGRDASCQDTKKNRGQGLGVKCSSWNNVKIPLRPAKYRQAKRA